MCCKQITTVSLDQNIKSNSAHSINLKHSLQIKTGFAAALQTCPSPPLDFRGFTSFKGRTQGQGSSECDETFA